MENKLENFKNKLEKFAQEYKTVTWKSNKKLYIKKLLWNITKLSIYSYLCYLAIISSYIVLNILGYLGAIDLLITGFFGHTKWYNNIINKIKQI